MGDLTPKENTALDIAMTRLGQLVDRMEKASHPYPSERTWSDCEAELAQQDAEIERLRGSEARALKALADTDDNCRTRFAEYRAEIERLRIERNRLAESLSVCGVIARGGDDTCLPEYETDSVIAVRVMRAEVERLRELVQLLNKLRPDAELARLRAAVRYAAQAIDAGVPLIEIRDKMVEVLDA